MIEVVLLLIVAVVIWLVRRKKRVSKQPLELQVAVVGFEASGKTVLVSSMFNELRVPDASGIFLDTSPESAGKLLALYNATADTDRKFPDSTSKGEMIEWPFTVKVRLPGAVAEAGKFSYLDFAGESLRDLYTGPVNPEARRLYDSFRNADVLMAVLDGQQVKRYMENRPWPGFQDDLGTLLALLSNHQKATNLILTKWDILEDHYTFRQVVTRLFQINHFANFVKAQQVVGVCRLIPVTSVGPGFVNEVGDSMEKVPGKVINPIRVQVPIACSLPGALLAAKQAPRLPAQSKWLALASVMKLNFGMVQIDLGSFGRRSVPATVTAGVNTPAPIAQLLRYCDGELNRLDAEFPESDLVRFMYQQGI